MKRQKFLRLSISVAPQLWLHESLVSRARSQRQIDDKPLFPRPSQATLLGKDLEFRLAEYLFLAQRPQQVFQTVVVDLLHQSQQLTDLAFGEAFSRKPVEVVAGQVGDQFAFVFAKIDFCFECDCLHG